MKIRFGAVLLVIIFLYSLHFVEAQPTKRVFRVGLLSGLRASPVPASTVALRQGLKELGYIEGQNIKIDYRWAEGNDDRFASLAAELVSLNVDVLVTQGARATIAAKQATSSIPIVVGSAGDLVGEGLVNSLARPGGNVTGFTNIEPDLSAKRLELLKELLPHVSRMAVLYHGGPGGDHDELRETQTAAKKLAVQIQPLLVLEPDQFQAAYAAMVKERAQASIIFQTVFTSVHRKELLKTAAEIRMPTMCVSQAWPEDGGLVSYGPDLRDQWRRAATYVDKILKGAKPADLPVQQPTKFELVINLKSAKQLGVTISSNVLARANKVIR